MDVKRIRWPALVLAAATLAAVSTVWAQSGGGYDASYTAFDGGGVTVGGGGYVMQTGVGQPMVGNTGAGPYSLDIGVLAGGSGAAGSPGSPTVSPSPSPSATAFPFKGYGPQVAKDGVN